MPAARLSSVIASLSLATEAAAGVPPETASRAAIVAATLAERLGLSESERRNLHYATLLRFIGCTSLAHEMSWYGAGDDIAILRTLTPPDSANVGSVLSHVVRDAARDQGMLARVRAVSRILREPELGRTLASAHCRQAAHLAGAMGIGEEVAATLDHSYERFDGRGGAYGLAGDRISLLARALKVAYVAVLHLAFGGPRRALDVLRERRGGELDPALVDALLPVLDGVLTRVAASSVWEQLADIEPAPREYVDDPARLAQAFAQFVDLKSRFTLGHSVGVAATVEAALRRREASDAELELGRLAGLLHDLGRASVPNGIWDKPGPLNRIELERARDHAQQSERILERAELLPGVASVVGAHHERVDGSGYPRRLAAAGLDPLARLLASADVYQALREERAYRPAHSAADAARLLEQEAQQGRLDRDAVADVLAASGQRLSLPRRAPAGLSERELEVLVLVARGLTNKQIGQRLFISPRTVGHHIAHIYEKTAVKTRAAAALFAVEHDLVSAPSK